MTGHSQALNNDIARETPAHDSRFAIVTEGRGRVFRLTSRWLLSGEVDEAIRIFHDMETMVDWWAAAFMRMEVVEPGGPESLGKVVRLHTKGLLPHTFQFLARVRAVDLKDAVAIEVRGDFRGSALVVAHKVGDLLELTFDWRIEVEHEWISKLAPFFRPIFAWNHRWVMRHGRDGFQREIYRRRGVPTPELPSVRTGPTFPHSFRFVRELYGWRRCPASWTD